MQKEVIMRSPTPKVFHSATKKNQVALKAFFKITQRWELSSDQERVLLGIPISTLYRWKNKNEGTLTPDNLERISYVLGIYKALRILLPTDAAANAWLKKVNSAPLFNGNTALDKLMQGHVIDLADVRRYLDAERGW
jgi:uncharacterized protein (DUF2384 family)